MSYVPPFGPVPAKVMLVGEAPGSDEVAARKPFIGTSGQELDRMLANAGINRSECFATNVVRYRPPNNEIKHFIPERKADITSDCVMVKNKWVKPVVAQGITELYKEVDLIKPNVILALGGTALWALTGNDGIMKWRGSLLDWKSTSHQCKIIPAYHPAAILRQWDWRFITVHDFRRAAAHMHSPFYEMPNYDFRVRPTIDQVWSDLAILRRQVETGPFKLAVDIETRNGHIACIGLAWSTLNALCIPLMCIERADGYWSEPEEAAILKELKWLLCHTNCEVIFQNGLYDCQYFARHFGWVPRTRYDTMILHHVLFAGMPKGLDFLSSLYCGFHRYWKDEGKNWDPSLGEEELWTYNCKDAVVTYEVLMALLGGLETSGLLSVADSQMELFHVLLEMMLRGVRIDLEQKENLVKLLGGEIETRRVWINKVVGHPLNVNSHKQMKALFYDDCQQQLILNRKTKQPTLDDEALHTIAKREPLLRPLIRRIAETRSLRVFKSTFAEAEVDKLDLRMRSSYNAAGTDTFRLSSSIDAFGSGMNLQNIPAGGSFDAEDPTALRLPNLRLLYIPDVGFIWVDLDLDRADLQVVVWEADDKDLKIALKAGIDLHILNGCLLFGRTIPPLDELVESHPNYPEHKRRYKVERQFAKIFVHGTNYGGSAKTMAGHTGTTVHAASQMQNRWFGAHPGILAWHRRVSDSLSRTRSLTNKFGYRKIFLDRIENAFTEALAWGPQSTVALVINQGMKNLRKSDIYSKYGIQLLMQVHDSCDLQYPIANDSPELRNLIREQFLVKIPYDDPLTIPVGLKFSEKSWGDCQ